MLSELVLMRNISNIFDKLSSTRFLIYTYLFFVALTTLVRIPVFFFDFFSNDEAAHFMGSIIIKNGMNLYTDFVDNKPPFIYLFYLLSQILFGENIRSVHIASSLFVIPIIAFSTTLLLYNRSRIAGLISGFLYIIFTSAYIPTDMLATNCEIIMLFFASIGFIFLLRNNFFLFGIFIGLSTLAKQQAAIWILIPFIFVLLKRDSQNSIRKTLYSLAGFSIPILLITTYFYLQGRLDSFIYYTIGHNIGYSQNPILLSEVIKRFFKYVIPYLIIISPLIYLYFRDRKNIDIEFRLTFEIALILSIIMIFVGFRFFPHYFIQAIYPLSILSGSYFINNDKKIKPIMYLVVYSLILVIFFTTYTFYFYSKKTDFIEETEPQFSLIPKNLKKKGLCNSDNKRIFIWGYAPLFYYYFYKECLMLPASRFILPQASTAGYIPGNESQFISREFKFDKFVDRESRSQLIQDLIKNKPSIIIDTSKSNFHHWGRYKLNTFPELNEFIKNNYSLYEDINGFEIYIAN